jgi:hypothetical protein
MNNDNFIVEGIFYTKKDGAIKGVARVQGNYWAIVKQDNSTFIRKDIFLDESKKIIAPKNEIEKDNSKKIVKDLLDKYLGKLKSYEDNLDFKNVSQSYQMGVGLAKKYINEYKIIYSKYFMSNTVKFILDDFLDDK